MLQASATFQGPNPLKALKASEGTGFNFLKAKKPDINRVNLISKTALSYIAIYTVYETILITLQTESDRKKGLITKSAQIKIITKRIAMSLRRSIAPSISLGILILLFPSLNLPFSIISLLGMGKASGDIFNAFWG